MWPCRTCGYRFESEEDLRRHEEEGRGCPEERPRFLFLQEPE